MPAIPHSFQRFTVYEPVTGDVAQCNSVIVDDTPMYVPPDPLDAPHDPYGNMYAGGYMHRFRGVFRDDDDQYAQFKTWRDAGTQIRLVAANTEGGKNLQWYESVLIHSLKPLEVRGRHQGMSDLYEIVLQYGGLGDIYNNINLLAYLGWTDVNLDGVPDGYTTTADMTGEVFHGSNGDFDAHGPTDGTPEWLFVDVVFPISGIRFTQSVEVVQLHVDGNTKMVTDQLSFADASLLATSTTHASIGRKSHTATTQSNIYSMSAIPLRIDGASAQTTKAIIRNPALTIGTSTTYTTY